MDNQFDKSALSLLIKRALGNRTQKSFAQDIQLSKEHLSRLITRKRDTPPNVDTLSKIALNSQNRVSLQELLLACGYDPNSINIPAPASLTHMMDALTIALSGIPYAGSYLPCKNTDFYQMILQFPEGLLQRWYFHFLPETTFAAASHELTTNLLSLISEEIDARNKISFVTSIPLLFQYYMEHRPYNLDLNFSLILVEEHTLSVSKEVLLQTAKSLPDDALNYYSLSSSPE